MDEGREKGMIDGRLSKARQFTLGADPEMFLFSGNTLIPAYEFLPPKGEKISLYWDGFQAEWKYTDVTIFCQNNLVMYTRQALMRLQARAVAYDAFARLSLANVVRIPQATLDTVDPRYVELGCQPSYNAYWLKGEPVYDPRKLPYRFAGGHMHFGTWNTPGRAVEYIRPNYERIVKTLDSILGIWAVGAARALDNPIRRRYYGLAGEYRKPKYADGLGVEYRVLSNWWLAAPSTLQVTWDIGRMCVRLASSLKYSKMWAGNEDETVDVINNCDVPRANAIIKRNEGMFRWLLGQVYWKQDSVTRALQLTYQGLESIVPEPEAIAANWHFEEAWIKDAGAAWARWEK
jgi:hypothetical protein